MGGVSGRCGVAGDGSQHTARIVPANARLFQPQVLRQRVRLQQAIHERFSICEPGQFGSAMRKFEGTELFDCAKMGETTLSHVISANKAPEK